MEPVDPAQIIAHGSSNVGKGLVIDVTARQQLLDLGAGLVVNGVATRARLAASSWRLSRSMAARLGTVKAPGLNRFTAEGPGVGAAELLNFGGRGSEAITGVSRRQPQHIDFIELGQTPICTDRFQIAGRR